MISGEVDLDGVPGAFEALGEPENHVKILVEPSPGVSIGSEPAPGPRRRISVVAKRIRPSAKVIFVLVAVGLIIWVLKDHSAELEGASAYLTHVKWEWIAIGVAAEVASIVTYALVQQRLIQAGQIQAPVGWLTGVTLANIAITNSLPTGSIIATIFTYRQYRQRGADEVSPAG